MTTTLLADVQCQIQTVWSELAMKELRSQILLPALVNKDYEGEIRQENDTVKVTTYKVPSNTIRTIGVDADTYDTKKLETASVSISNVVGLRSLADIIIGASISCVKSSP